RPRIARASTSTPCRTRSTGSRTACAARRSSWVEGGIGEGGIVSEFDQLYREVILDHYKNPRGHGVLEGADAVAEGQNPLCGDEVAIYVAFGDDGETIDEVKFSGRGCAISQA